MRIRNIKERLATLPQFVNQIPLNARENRGLWKTKFQKNQLVIEIGTGKGTFLTEHAARNPDILFVGIDKFTPVLVAAAKKAKEKELINIVFIDTDVSELGEYFEDHEVDGLFINFVDPWPKKKHEKRRLTHPLFLQIYRQLLTSNGRIQLKTDNEGLFEYSLNQFLNRGFKLQDITFNLHESAFESENIWTEYETRYAMQGMKIYQCRAYC